VIARILDGRAIAEEVRGEVKQGVDLLRLESGVTPGLAVVLVGRDPASEMYVAAKERAARAVGIKTETIRLSVDCCESDLLLEIERLNRDSRFHGVLAQLPLPSHIDPMTVIRAVSPMKDVDGLHPENMGLLLMGTPRFITCTPSGIQRVLVDSGVSTEGRHLVICGRSRVVGRPLAALMMQKDRGANATVTIAHTGTRNLASLCQQADILVVAIDKPKGVTADMVKKGAAVIDVGIHRVSDSTARKGYRIVGDVDFDSVKERAGHITPVPGGVGPMTVAMLLVNTLKAARLAGRTGEPSPYTSAAV